MSTAKTRTRSFATLLLEEASFWAGYDFIHNYHVRPGNPNKLGIILLPYLPVPMVLFQRGLVIIW